MSAINIPGALLQTKLCCADRHSPWLYLLIVHACHLSLPDTVCASYLSCECFSFILAESTGCTRRIPWSRTSSHG